MTVNLTSKINATLLQGMHDRQLSGNHPKVHFRSDAFCPRGMGREARQQINGVTAFIDGSQIYGSDDETSLGLRDGAKLRTHSKTNRFGEGHLPMRSQCGFPAGSPNPTGKDLTAGDTRAIVQPALASIHTLFLNEHNRIAENLIQLADDSSNVKMTDLTSVERENFVFEVNICHHLPSMSPTKRLSNLKTLSHRHLNALPKHPRQIQHIQIISIKINSQLCSLPGS